MVNVCVAMDLNGSIACVKGHWHIVRGSTFNIPERECPTHWAWTICRAEDGRTIFHPYEEFDVTSAVHTLCRHQEYGKLDTSFGIGEYFPRAYIQSIKVSNSAPDASVKVPSVITQMNPARVNRNNEWNVLNRFMIFSPLWCQTKHRYYRSSRSVR